jgi:hypothetical protein
LSARRLGWRTGRRLEDRRRRSGGRAIRPDRRQLVLVGLTVGDKLPVTRGARPRRHIVRHAARPMRPMIGDKGGEAILRPGSGAGRKDEAGAQNGCRRGDPPAAENAPCHVLSTARRSHRLPFAALPERRFVC